MGSFIKEHILKEQIFEWKPSSMGICLSNQHKHKRSNNHSYHGVQRVLSENIMSNMTTEFEENKTRESACKISQRSSRRSLHKVDSNDMKSIQGLSIKGTETDAKKIYSCNCKQGADRI